MKKILTLVLLIPCLIGTQHSHGQNNPIPQLDSIMRVASARGIFNGNILVAQKGKIIYEGSFGYADGSRQIPLNKDLRFDIGSISKEFNGTSIMLLKERGLLSLDDAVSKYIKGLPAWADRVKIRHLINYTSGIPLFTATAAETDQEILQNLTTLKDLKFTPGTAYIYNHYNVYLQERIVEKVSGMSYADFVKQYILIPCGMDSTIVDYPLTGKGMARAFDSEFKETAYLQGMTGWLRLPVMDLYRWTEHLHNYSLINKASLQELGIAFAGGESSLGTTAFENGELSWHQHQGSNSNYEALFYASLKDSVTIVMMTNNQQLKVHGIKSAILALLKQQPFVVPQKSVYLEVREKLLANFEQGLAYYQRLRSDHRDQYDFSFEIGDLISAGKYLQRRSKFDNAIRLFQMAAKLEGKPADISYAYELIGESYFKQEKKPEAMLYYQQALTTDPNNKNAAGMLATLRQ